MILNHKSNAEQTRDYPHRPAGISLTNLLQGADGAPDNFVFELVETNGEYFTPRHHHNFEQVRYMLKGDFEWAPGVKQEEGTVGYFCEGTYYTQKSVGHSIILSLQLGGASGYGFMSRRQLREGGEALAKTGTFHDGVYTWHDQAGRKHNKDGYEAVWEHVNGRKLEYPPARYDAPVILRPAHFAYLPMAGVEGVATKELGRFNERGLEIKQIRMDAGASYAVDGRSKSYLFFVLSGEGTANGELWGPQTALRVERDEVVTLATREAAEFYAIGLPTFA
jgi:hypothetical protein